MTVRVNSRVNVSLLCVVVISHQVKNCAYCFFFLCFVSCWYYIIEDILFSIVYKSCTVSLEET